MPDKLYISKLWQTSRLLFAGVFLFVLGQAFFTYKGILNFPFFPYEMYAHPAKKATNTSVTYIYVNDSILNYTSLPDWMEGTILNTLQYYSKFERGNIWAAQVWNTRFGRPDTEFKKLIYHRLVPTEQQMSNYPEWLANYIESNILLKVNSINILKKDYHYENQRLVSTGEETVLLDYRR